MAADLTMTGTPALADPHAPVRVSVVAGEAINAGDACFIHTDGKAYQCDSADHTGIANVSKFDGISINACSIGGTTTLFGVGAKIKLTDTAQTIGSFWYVGANQGVLYDTKVATADTYLPVVKFISATVAQVVRGGV
jgi:hypothetical protein